LRGLSCKTKEIDEPHGGKSMQKSILMCCDLLDFCWIGVYQQIPLAGFLNSYMGVSVSIKAEIYEQMNNYRLSKTFLHHGINPVTEDAKFTRHMWK